MVPKCCYNIVASANIQLHDRRRAIAILFRGVRARPGGATKKRRLVVDAEKIYCFEAPSKEGRGNGTFLSRARGVLLFVVLALSARFELSLRLSVLITLFDYTQRMVLVLLLVSRSLLITTRLLRANAGSRFRFQVRVRLVGGF